MQHGSVVILSFFRSGKKFIFLGLCIPNYFISEKGKVQRQFFEYTCILYIFWLKYDKNTH